MLSEIEGCIPALRRYARALLRSREDDDDLDGCAWVERVIGCSLVAKEDYAHILGLSRDDRQELPLRR